MFDPCFQINAICFKLELVKEDLGDIKVTLYEKNGRSPHFRDYFIFETSNSEYAIPKQYVGSCRQGSSLDHEFSGKIYPKTEDGQESCNDTEMLKPKKLISQTGVTRLRNS